MSDVVLDGPVECECGGAAGDSDARGRQAAASLRAQLAFGDAPIVDMVDLVEARAQCDVAIEAMTDDVAGMVATDPASGHRIIAVATTTVPYQQRFALAHELGHVEVGRLGGHTLGGRLGGDPVLAGNRSAAEAAADAFARHLLLPLEGVQRMRRDMPSATGAEALSELVRIYRVSPTVAAVQMRDAGWFADDVELGRHDARQLATRFGWRPEYDVWVAEASRPRPPRRLLRRTMDAYVAGIVSIAAVAQVWGQSVTLAQEQLDAEGIRPIEPPIAWFDPDA